jgi:hypothetical protein
MRTTLCRSLLSVLACAALLALPGCDNDRDGEKTKEKDAKTAPKTPPAAKKEAEPEWMSLFDGKTFGKWKETEFGGQGKPRIENGTIILPMGNMLTGLTYTGSGLPTMNYEIELEAQRVEGSDFFCGFTFPVKESAASLILGGWGGSVCGISSFDGLDAANNETTKVISFDDKKWYKVRVCVLEGKIQAWLDDERIVDANTKGRKVDVRMEVELSKPLGICSFATVGAFRNIRVRTLRADETINDE